MGKILKKLAVSAAIGCVGLWLTPEASAEPSGTVLCSGGGATLARCVKNSSLIGYAAHINPNTSTNYVDMRVYTRSNCNVRCNMQISMVGGPVFYYPNLPPGAYSQVVNGRPSNMAVLCYCQ